MLFENAKVRRQTSDPGLASRRVLAPFPLKPSCSPSSVGLRLQTEPLTSEHNWQAACTDAVGTGITPIPNTNPWMALYCAAHIIIGAFVLLNLIVGSVINNYNKIKSQNDGPAASHAPTRRLGRGFGCEGFGAIRRAGHSVCAS